jgi:hypothetical protein
LANKPYKPAFCGERLGLSAKHCAAAPCAEQVVEVKRNRNQAVLQFGAPLHNLRRPGAHFGQSGRRD